ncbi:MAG: hypothetical protein ABIJ09_05635 [Pseudomonadota bacterium]
MRIANPRTLAHGASSPPVKVSHAKGIVRTPQRPRTKEVISKPNPLETGAARDFARQRTPEDLVGQRMGQAAQGVSRAFGGKDRGLLSRLGGRDDLQHAARAEAQGQRGALWNHLRDAIERTTQDRFGDLPGRRPPFPIQGIGPKHLKPDIIRTPSLPAKLPGGIWGP